MHKSATYFKSYQTERFYCTSVAAQKKRQTNTVNLF